MIDWKEQINAAKAATNTTLDALSELLQCGKSTLTSLMDARYKGREPGYSLGDKIIRLAKKKPKKPLNPLRKVPQKT